MLDIALSPAELTVDDHALIASKPLATRSTFAALFQYFKQHASFPEGNTLSEIGERTQERYRQEFRAHFGTREHSNADMTSLTEWLCENAVHSTRDGDELASLLRSRCRDVRIEAPSDERIDRIIRAAIASYDDRLCCSISSVIPPASKLKLDQLLSTDDGDENAAAPLLSLRKSPGRPGVASVKTETAKLRLVREVGLPADVFATTKPHDIERFRQRAGVEAPYELRRHPHDLRMTLLAAFVHTRGRTATDDLVDLLIETIHMIDARAEKKATAELVEDFKKVRGKEGILCAVADAALERPDGIIKDVVFPVAGEQVAAGFCWQSEGQRDGWRSRTRPGLARHLRLVLKGRTAQWHTWDQHRSQLGPAPATPSSSNSLSASTRRGSLQAPTSTQDSHSLPSHALN